MISAVILWWGVLIDLICLLLLIIYLLCNIFSRFVFDGGDFRSPYLIILFTFMIFCVCELLFFLITGITTVFLQVLSQNFLLMTVTFLLKSRLLCYPGVFIDKKTKSYLHYIVSMLFLIVFYVSLLSYNVADLPISPIQSWTQIDIYVELVFAKFYNNWSVMVAVCFFISLIIWFDTKEQRTNKLLFDYLLMGSLIIAILGGFDIIQLLPVVLQFVVIFTFYTFQIFFVVKEAFSIMRHSQDIDVRITTTNKIIDSITKSKTLTKAEEFQLKYIAKLCAEDEHFSEHILNRKIYSRKHRKLYKKIKELQNV